jgi:hypothetical protein
MFAESTGLAVVPPVVTGSTGVVTGSTGQGILWADCYAEWKLRWAKLVQEILGIDARVVW